MEEELELEKQKPQNFLDLMSADQISRSNNAVPNHNNSSQIIHLEFTPSKLDEANKSKDSDQMSEEFFKQMQQTLSPRRSYEKSWNNYQNDDSWMSICYLRSIYKYLQISL